MVNLNWCKKQDKGIKIIEPNDHTNILKSAQTEGVIDGKLRTFRLALATTGEYSQSILTIQGIPENATDEVKKTTVLAQLNKLMTSVNAIFERDICITMKLVPNNLSLIFFGHPRRWLIKIIFFIV
jgi:C4-dicarboxylate-specific signal transduction histidine kinase